MYFTGARYAKFIDIIAAEKTAKELGDLRTVIFQDDQDHKQRMGMPLVSVKYVFINRIELINCPAKLADVWSI